MSFSRVRSAVSFAVLTAASAKLYVSVWTAGVMMVEDSSRPPLFLTGAMIVGAWACSIFALRNFRHAFFSEQTGET